MQTALITGGSSGIGRELAHVMAEKGHNLVLSARNKDGLSEVKKELEKAHNITVKTVVSDLSKPGSGC